MFKFKGWGVCKHASFWQFRWKMRENILKIAKKIEANGGKLYLVGGVARN